MKKRILLSLSLLCLLGLLFVLASCGHEHVYGSKYGYDDNNHWQVCIAADGDGCTEISGTAKHALKEVSRKDPTCDKAGELVQKCECGYKKTSVLDPLGHDIEEDVVAPTCDKEGYTKVSCKIAGCRYSEKINITAPAHSVVENVVPPTCSSEGYTELTCSAFRCDYYEKVNIVPPSHAYADKVVEPTCTEKGYVKVVCLLCEDVKETKDEVEALGHQLTENVVAPTCTSKGYTAVACTREGCEYTDVKDEKDILPHSYKTFVVAPTCTEGGYTTEKCDACGTESGISNETAPLDHDYIRKEKAATCFTGGYTTVTCSRCDYKATEDVKEALGHDYYIEVDSKKDIHYVLVTPATCTEEGEAYYICTRCSMISEEVGTLPALGHKEYEGTRAPTCTEKGAILKMCERCDWEADEIISEIDALGHKEEEKVVAPTCEEEGETRIVCTVCLAKLSTVEGTTVSALGHEYKMDLGEDEEEGVHFEITKNPTCTENGEKSYICQREECGRTAEAEKNPEAIVSIEPIGHNFQVTVEPWCGNGGKREYICTNIVDGVACNTTSVMDGELPLYRHSYPTNGVAVVEATCITYGRYICSAVNPAGVACNTEFEAYEDDDLGQPVEHEYDEFIETVLPTCTEKGYDVFGCSKGECGLTEKRNYTEVYSHRIVSVSDDGVTICDTCQKSFVDITVESSDFEQDVICMGCGKTPCICGVVGGGSGYGEPNAPISITANEPCTVTGVELASGWKDLAIGYGLIILNSEETAEYVVLIYTEDGAEPIEFTADGSGMVVVDLYEVSTVVKVVITSNADAAVSFYKPF